MDSLGELRLTENSFNKIVEKAKDWALLHGFTMRLKYESSDNQIFLAFALFPSSFPRKEYDKIRLLQPIINKLMHRIAYDSDFLLQALQKVAIVDDFTYRLIEIYKKTKYGKQQMATLGLLRSDFMLDVEKENNNRREVTDGWKSAITASCKQVEVNTIASGQGWIGTASSRLHHYVLKELELGHSAANLPHNNPLNGLCRAMYEAWQFYKNPSAAILFVVEDITEHIADQRYHEYQLRELDPQIRVLRRTLTEIYHSSKLESSENRLFIDNEEIALIYFRSGYSPQQYKGEAEWEARLRMEKSKAIKCPTVGLQLAGTKKVQQVLTEPGYLERFLEIGECKKLKISFAGHYALDSTEEGETVIQKALTKPENFVLKPQREGGSNNFFGEDLKIKLESIKNKQERYAWILMDRINAPVQRNYLVRSNEIMDHVKQTDITSELGIFGAVLGDKKNIFLNTTCGHNLRTKPAECDEGGLSYGAGHCDSPFLI